MFYLLDVYDLKTISYGYLLKKNVYFTVFKVQEEIYSMCCECVDFVTRKVFSAICNLDEHHAYTVNDFTVLFFIDKISKSGYSVLEKQLFSWKSSKICSGSVHAILLCVYHR